MSLNVLVAGATGAVGQPLTRLLRRQGHRVLAMTRRPDRADALWALGAIPVVADVFDAAKLDSVLAATRPDAVMHQLTDLAMLREPGRLDAALARNAEVRKTGTANLVAAAQAAGVARVVAQSIAWAYRADPEPHTEETPLDLDATGARAITVAGVAALEHLVLDTPGLHGCVLRYGRLYGPGTGNADSRGIDLPLHVEAAAWAAVLALERNAVGAFNVAEPTPRLSTRKATQALGWDAALRA